MRQLLFIQGAGEGAYDEDAKLASSLQEALGPDYDVRYPRMPEEDDLDDRLWKEHIAKKVANFTGEDVLVGHSAGAYVLLDYLTEKRLDRPVAGIFLIATPYIGGEGWKIDGVGLNEDFVSNLPEAPIFLYHSRDDEVVPFTHLAMYAEKIPQATIREFDSGGHQFNDDLSQVAADITGL